MFSVLIAALLQVLCQDAFAIAAWGRRYGDCTACHARLNVLNQNGRQFLMSGHRMGNEEEGESINQYLSVTEKFRMIVTDKEDSKVSTDFQMEALSVYSGGPLDKNLSYFFEFYLYDYGKEVGHASLGATKLADAYAQYNYWLTDTNFLAVRAGHMIPFLVHTHEGGARLPVSRPLVIADKSWSKTSVDSAGIAVGTADIKYSLRERSMGVEVSGYFSPVYVALGAVNGDQYATGDINNFKDQYVTAQVNLGPGNIGVYGYNGKYPITVGRFSYNDEFQRYGVLGDVAISNLTLSGAYILGKNTLPDVSNESEVSKSGFYLLGYFLATDRVAPFVRYDLVDPDTDVDNDETKAIVGGVSLVVSRYGRLSIEGTSTTVGDADAVNAVTAEFQWMY